MIEDLIGLSYTSIQVKLVPSFETSLTPGAFYNDQQGQLPVHH